MWNRALPIVVLFVACGGDGQDAKGIPEQCNPLGGQGCLLPWPSMAYVKADSTTATGFRLDLPRDAMPKNGDGVVVEPDWFNRWDGFSAVGPLLAAFPGGVSGDRLPSFKDPAASLAADSPIVLVDIDTGERAPVFAELDQNIADVTARNLIIRPLVRLNTSARYAVAIRTTVKAADGGELEVAPAFAALRDGGELDHPRFAALADGSDAMFGALAAAGVARNEIALAWDFVTASDEFLRSDLTTMRDAALPAIGSDGANLSFTVDAPQTTFPKLYLGTYKSPDFLTDGEADASVLRRDVTGKPELRGLRDARFAAVVPSCVQTQPLPRPVVIFGHGLFGSAAEYLGDGFVAELAELHCFVVIAGDFIGLTSRNIGLAPAAASNLNKGFQVSEKLAQSIIDFIALESVARGPMAAAAEFQHNDQSVIDPARTFYLGGSLGGIMGNVFMAYDPNITRGVLAVPGGNWSLLLERSAAWTLLKAIAQGAYSDPEIYQLNVALGFGMGLEPYDPITTAAHVIKDPLPGVPVKNILIWYAIGDSLVTNLATEMIAREMDIPLLAPSVRTPFGLTPMTGPLANGITVYDDHPDPLPPETNTPPPSDNGTHSGINQKAAALRQVESFLLGRSTSPGGPESDPAATNECRVGNAVAACDCATGACD